MEPRTDNLTTKCSVALLTSLLMLIFQSVLISQIDFLLHLKKRKWNYLGGKRNDLQHKKHTSNDTSQVQGTWTPRKKNKKMKTKEGAKKPKICTKEGAKLDKETTGKENLGQLLNLL